MSKEIIELLEKMVKDAENIQGYAHRHSEAVIKTRECFAIQIQLRGDQALTLLQQLEEPHPCNYVNEKRLEQQPTAGEFTKRIRTEPYNPKWEHTLIIRTEDRDELCDRLDRVEAENGKLLDIIMAAGFIGQGTQIIGDKRYEELMIAEARNKDLLEVCEKAFEESHNPKVEKILEATIAKANKINKRDGTPPP